MCFEVLEMKEGVDTGKIYLAEDAVGQLIVIGFDLESLEKVLYLMKKIGLI